MPLEEYLRNAEIKEFEDLGDGRYRAKAVLPDEHGTVTLHRGFCGKKGYQYFIHMNTDLHNHIIIIDNAGTRIYPDELVTMCLHSKKTGALLYAFRYEEQFKAKTEKLISAFEAQLDFSKLKKRNYDLLKQISFEVGEYTDWKIDCPSLDFFNLTPQKDNVGEVHIKYEQGAFTIIYSGKYKYHSVETRIDVEGSTVYYPNDYYTPEQIKEIVSKVRKLLDHAMGMEIVHRFVAKSIEKREIEKAMKAPERLKAIDDFLNL